MNNKIIKIKFSPMVIMMIVGIIMQALKFVLWGIANTSEYVKADFSIIPFIEFLFLGVYFAFFDNNKKFRWLTCIWLAYRAVSNITGLISYIGTYYQFIGIGSNVLENVIGTIVGLTGIVLLMIGILKNNRIVFAIGVAIPVLSSVVNIINNFSSMAQINYEYIKILLTGNIIHTLSCMLIYIALTISLYPSKERVRKQKEDSIEEHLNELKIKFENGEMPEEEYLSKREEILNLL